MKLLFKFIKKEELPGKAGAVLNTISCISPLWAARLTLYLYSKPMKGRLDEEMEKFLASADENPVLTFNNQIPIQTYHWKGNGPTVLLLHGWESNASRWRLFIKLLQRSDYNIVAMDGPMHGKTGGNRFSAILYAQLAEVVVKHYSANFVVGHSVGGMTTAYLGSHFDLPSLKGLVLIASSNRWLDVADRFHSALGLNKKVVQAFDKVFYDWYKKPQSYYNAEDFAANINLPGLIVHDSTDMVNYVEDGKSIHQNWSDSQYIETKGYGHSLQSKDTYLKIIEFLNGK
jgi:pimeloyl-ACP methyl ester carboxylesterase